MNKKDIQSFYTYLQSQQTAQQYLLHCYEKNGESEAKKRAMLISMPFYTM